MTDVAEPPTGADLGGLKLAAAACRACELWEPATQTIFGRGPARARMVLVGEQPGDVEDRQGVPFVGPAGRLLVDAVEAAGIDKASVYVTNAVKHFRFTPSSSGRRIHQTPDLSHLTACRPWLAAELNVIRPEMVVLLGASAAKTLLGQDFRVTRQRGQVMPGPAGSGARLLATLHPSAVLRTPPESRDEAFSGLVADLRVARESLR
ncbi:MAG TPA: UdgX family uracil-DNA binding protein [Mycobacteriales bacterium]